MSPPKYKIENFSPDHVSSEKGSRSIEIAQRLWQVIGTDGSNPRPNSMLLRPEIIFLDAMHFETSMGNGFATLLGYFRGLQTFARALVAFREIDVPVQYNLLLRAKAIAESHGLMFPDPVPEGWENGQGIDYTLEQAIDEETRVLDVEYWDTFGSEAHDFYLALLRYMASKGTELAIRANS